MKNLYILIFAVILSAGNLKADKTEYIIEFDTRNIQSIAELTGDMLKGSKRNFKFDKNDVFSSEISYIFAVDNSADFDFEINQIAELDIYNKTIIPDKFNHGHFEIIELGIYRGVKLKKVIIKPFIYNPSTQKAEVIRSAKLVHKSDIKSKRKNISLRDYSFIENVGQVPYLFSDKQDKSFQSSFEQLDLNKKYLKILTKSDRIYKISFSDIFGILPDLAGKNMQNLRLINSGSDVPFFIKSSDNSISSDDYLYFYGKHRRSDSTYYNFYGQEEAYFFFYDEEKEGSHYSESNISGNYDELRTVNATYHYERDSIYNYYEMNTEQYHNEGWYWAEIFPDRKYIKRSVFAPKLFISPSEDINNDIEIKAYYKSYDDIVYKQPYIRYYTYNLDLIINKNTYDNETFEGFRNDYLNATLNNESLIYGLNEIKVKSNSTFPDSTNYTGIDHIIVSGKMKPQAVEERLNFEYQSSNPAELNIPNFKNSEIAAVNISDNEIFFPDILKGYNFNIGAIANRGFSVGMNDDFIYNSEPAVYFIALNNNEAIRANSVKSENAVKNAMNNLPDNSPFIFLAYQANAVNDFSSELKDFGAETNSGYKSGDIYVLAGIKGTDDLIENTDVNSININTFIEHNSSGFASAKFNVPASEKSDFFISNIADDDDYELRAVSDDNLYEPQQVDYLIISHKNFKGGIKELADYRNKTKGVSYKIVDAEDVYNQFDDGIKSPFAIKNYIDYVYHNYEEPFVSDILLVGDASWDPRGNFDVSVAKNFLPSYGMPVSDFWYVAVAGDDLLPDINIGRLPANDNTELDNMISKIITYDTVQVRQWMKEMLFLSGGISEDEIRRFKNRIPFVNEDIFESEPMGGKGSTIVKSSTSASGEENAGEIRAAINEGKLWTNFLGHASSEIFDMDGWQVETLSNNKRLGILTTLSCNTGAFAEPPLKDCRNETYLKAKDKGFAGIISGTATGSVGHQWSIFSSMVTAFADSSLKYRELGDILTYSKVRTLNPDDPVNVQTVYQMSILGDPLTSLRLDENTDLFLDGNEIAYFNEEGSDVFSEDNETINITGFVNNNGYCTDERFELKIIRYAEDYDFRDTLTVNYDGVCFNGEFEIELPVLNMAGEHKIELIVDPENVVNDTKRYNNSYEIIVNVLSQSLIILEPKNAGIINRNEPVFRIIDPFNYNNDDINYEFYITEQKDSEDYLISSKSDEIEINSTHIDWKPDLSSLETDKNYWFKAGYNTQTSFAKWSYSNFSPEEGAITEDDKWMLNSTEQFSHFFENKSKNIDILEFDKVTLNSDTIPYKMISFIGDKSVVPNIKTWIDIQIGENVYAVGQFWRGFHIVTLPADISKGRGKHRRFDTWGNEDSFNDDFWVDSSAVKLVEFLEDSVRKDEYLFVSSSHSSFRLLRKHYEEQPESKGNLDSLIKSLKIYGATLADSLNDGDIVRTDNATYQLVSRKGSGNPVEKLIFTKDSLITNGSIIRHNIKGNIITDDIGPAKIWRTLQIEGDISDFHSVSIHIIGIGNDTEDTLITNNDFSEIDLSSINASDYRNIRIEIELQINQIEFEGFDTIEKPEINNITVDYIPLPEIAVVPESISLMPESVLLKQPAKVNYTLKNLSLRADAGETEYRIKGAKEKGETFYENYHRITGIERDSEIENTMDIATDDIDNINFVRGNLTSTNDIYNFNNDFSTKLYRVTDTLKPNIRIKVDGKHVYPGDYISAKPTIEIELFDNSFISITDSTKISARLNGYYHPGDRTEFAKFETVNDSSLKAVFTFRPDTIEYEDILLIAYVADADNNRDTVKTNLNTSLRNSKIQESLSVPNPFSEETYFEFLFITPKVEADAEVLIYDVAGSLIRKIETNVSAGINRIRWDGKMENDAEAPIGMYYYRINIHNAGFVEPVNGKTVKME